MAHRKWKKLLDFVGNLDHITLWSGGGQVIPSVTAGIWLHGYGFDFGQGSTKLEGDCWA